MTNAASDMNHFDRCTHHFVRQCLEDRQIPCRLCRPLDLGRLAVLELALVAIQHRRQMNNFPVLPFGLYIHCRQRLPWVHLGPGDLDGLGYRRQGRQRVHSPPEVPVGPWEFHVKLYYFLNDINSDFTHLGAIQPRKTW